MRTIKFRGLEANPYCEELRTFLYGTPLFITNEENYILPNFWDYEGLNKFKVLKKTISQFTGLHDKNGKEIYEGDILEDTLGRKKLVEYYKDGFWLNASFDGAEWCLRQVNSSSKIIGNTYENPELISKTPNHEH